MTPTQLKRQRHNKYIAIIFSFIGAVLFWGFHVLKDNYKTKVSLDVIYSYNYKDSLAVISPPLDKVQLEVEGRGWDLMKLSSFYLPDPLIYTIDEPFENSYIDKKKFLEVCKHQLHAVDVKRVITDTITYQLEHIRRKVVYLYTDRKNLKGITIGGQRYKPKVRLNTHKVKIIGPKNSVDTVNSKLTLLIAKSQNHELGNESRQKYNIAHLYDQKWFKVEPKEVICTVSFEKI